MKAIILLLMFLPLILLSQEQENQQLENPEVVIESEASLIEQFAQVSSMSINPYTAVFITSVFSKFGWHNDYVKSHPFYNSWFAVALFGILFFITLVVRPILATNKFTNVLKMADEYLEDKLVYVINGVILLTPIFFDSNLDSKEIIIETGVFTMSFKTIIILFATTYYLIIVIALRSFVVSLIFLLPIPFIDSLMVISKILFTAVLVFLSVYSPILTFIVSIILFVIGIFVYGKSKKLDDKITFFFIFPVIDLMRKKSKILYNKKGDLSFKVFIKNKTKRFKKGKILTLIQEKQKFKLIKKRLLRPNKSEVINLKDCKIIQRDFDTTITTKDGIEIILNKTFAKHINILSKDFGTSNLEINKMKFTKAKGLIGRVKKLFSKQDFKKFKTFYR